MKKHAFFFILFFTSYFILSGCLTVHYVTLISPDSGAKLTVLVTMPVKSGTGNVEANSYFKSGPDSLTYPTGSWTSAIKVRMEKKGYRTKICEVYKPFYLRNKLPTLAPYPIYQEGQRHMYIESVSVNIDSNRMIKNFYPTWDDFSNNKSTNSIPNKRKISYKNIRIDDDMNNTLIDLNYIDTTAQKELRFFDYNWLEVHANVTDLYWNDVNYTSCVDVTCSWKIQECLTGKTLYKHSIVSRSNWGNEGDSLISDALMQGLYDFLKDSGTRACLVNGDVAYENTFSRWDTLAIPYSQNYSNNIQQATNAVVTIKLPNGHGSGCLISSNGYIITNSHVAGDTNLYTIIFQNGNTHFAHLIRSNPLIDLAILKVDSVPTDVSPLQIMNGSTWSIGNEVFAIGTPEHVELGQTLTRGIISGVRTIQNVKYIQTDASISPGNSGGALTNTDGKLIGIVKAKIIGGGSSGLGFVISSDYIQKGLKLKFQ